MDETPAQIADPQPEMDELLQQAMIIPFFIPHAGCPHRCVFCNQKSITGLAGPPSPESVASTIVAYLRADGHARPAQVAFYGGSFTALPLEVQHSYLEAVRSCSSDGRVSGIRLSTRPDCINGENLSLLERYNARTVELGVQSMDDDVLNRSHRGHTADDTRRSVSLLRKRGFAVGMQLMIGLPGDSAEGFLATVEETVKLGPDFVRLYPALVIRGTRLEALYHAGHYRPCTMEDAVTQCRDACRRFDHAGIPVIRIGLQPTRELETPGVIVAGPFHPAFGQLVASAELLDRMRTLLRRSALPGRSVVVQVHPKDMAAAVGQRRDNIMRLRNEFGLQSVRIVAASAGSARRTPVLLSTAEV